MLKLLFADKAGRSVWLVGERLRVGSDRHNELVLQGEGIQPFHAQFLIDQDKVTLQLCDGAAVVNRKPVREDQPLHHGDLLQLGGQSLLVLDPKRRTTEEEIAAMLPATGQATVKGWSLQAEHPKLRHLPFAINARAVLGRAEDCELRVPYKLLSRHHAEFVLAEGGLQVKDLGSANGTFVNGQRVQQARLRSGDHIVFAKLSFVVSGPDSAPPADNLQKTMVRPALDIEQLRSATRESQAIPDSLIAASEEAESTPQASARRGWHLALAVLAVVAGAALLWLLR